MLTPVHENDAPARFFILVSLLTVFGLCQQPNLKPPQRRYPPQQNLPRVGSAQKNGAILVFICLRYLIRPYLTYRGSTH